MEKYLANLAIRRESLMINTTKFPSKSSHHDNFWSCHLIVARKLPNDHRHVHDFIDTDFFVGKVFLLYSRNGLHPQTLTFFSLLCSFTANDCTVTVILRLSLMVIFYSYVGRRTYSCAPVLIAD